VRNITNNVDEVQDVEKGIAAAVDLPHPGLYFSTFLKQPSTELR
jgi:hypothetical protein